jgi:hypothetical protein
MNTLKARLLSWAIQAALLLALLGILVTMTITGILWALSSLQALLEPVVGAAASLAVVSLVCLSPLLIAWFFIKRLQRQLVSDASVAQRDALSLLVQDKPWELASLAFLFGFTYRDDPALRQWLLRAAMQTLANDPDRTENTNSGDH